MKLKLKLKQFRLKFKKPKLKLEKLKLKLLKLGPEAKVVDKLIPSAAAKTRANTAQPQIEWSNLNF